MNVLLAYNDDLVRYKCTLSISERANMRQLGIWLRKRQLMAFAGAAF